MRLTNENIKEFTRFSDVLTALHEEFPDWPLLQVLRRGVAKLTVEQDEAAMTHILANQEPKIQEVLDLFEYPPLPNC